jgi:hypothetical protein
MGATRVEERLDAAFGGITDIPVRFEASQSISWGGVLFLLPFLLVAGLLSYRRYYSQRGSGYYGFDSVLLAIAFMYLCRIKTIEKLKHLSSGEFGKLLGLDRIPESRCFRGILRELGDQQKAPEWGAYLAGEWIAQEDPGIYYIDGHVQVYHGYFANLGKKHVSRQKLCLPGMMEFWVNNFEGLPYFFVTGQVNEKLQEALVNEIIPQLDQIPFAGASEQELENDPLFPRYTLVFDREAYSPRFFGSLWNDKRIAIITYRKNVKECWDENLFSDYDIDTEMGKTTMLLHEKEIVVDGVSMREVRKLNDGGHQTSVVTTNRKLSTILIALYMFSRWTQENFFGYMRQEYDLDRIVQYGVDEIDSKIMVVNREYSNLTYQIKKTREKISRREALLFTMKEDNIRSDLDQTSKNLHNQLKVHQELKILQEKEQDLIEKRKQQPYKISIGDMPESTRYNKLKTECKHIQNIIKILCYRAETAFANLLSPNYARSKDEIRALVKSVVFNTADIIPDSTNGTLTVCLYSLATNRDNIAVGNVCQILNDTETIFPGTNLRLIFKSATI